jgi:rubredoxin
MKLIDINKLKEILDFEAGCYYLLLIARKKNNKDITHSKEIIYRRTIYSSEKLEIYINELVAISEYDKEHEYKLYISLNPRNVLKAYTNLKQKIAIYDMEMINNPAIINKILKLDEEWISCLARSPAKKKYFMLDLDDKKQLCLVESSLKTFNIKVEYLFETKNGHHLLFKPCDTRLLMEAIKVNKIDCELKRDDLLCIGYEDNNFKQDILNTQKIIEETANKHIELFRLLEAKKENKLSRKGLNRFDELQNKWRCPVCGDYFNKNDKKGHISRCLKKFV